MATTKILIAQAQPSIATDIRQRLEALGYSVAAVVSSGGEAIRESQNLRPDLVMADTVLEGGSDGIEAARWIRSRLKIPIVYLTTHKDEDTLERAKATRPSAFVTLPLDDRQLQIAVEVALYAHRTRHDTAEERFQRFIHQNPFPIMICSANGTATAVNQAFLDMFAIPSADEVVGKYNIFEDKVLMDLGLRESIEKVCAGDMMFVAELVVPLERLRYYRGSNKKGVMVTEVTMFPVFDSEGRVCEILMRCKDIAKRWKAEQELDTFARMGTRLAAARTEEQVSIVVREESERLLGWDGHYIAFRRIEHDTFHVCWFVDTVGSEKKLFPGREWPVKDIDEAIRGLLLSQPVLINRKPGDSSPHIGGFGDTSRPSASLMFVPVRSGDAVIGVLSAQSYTHDRYNQSDLAVLQRMADVIAPALARVHAENRLEEANEELQAIIEASPAAIVVLDSEGNVKLWSPAAERMFGWKEEEALGRRPPIILPDHVEEFEALFEMHREGKSAKAIELYRQRKDGTPIKVVLSAAPLHDASGNFVGTVGVLTDISETK